MLPLPWSEETCTSHRNPKKTRTRFPCPRCRKSYTTKSAVTAHFKYDCGKPPRFECPYCGKLSKKKFNIQDHIRHKHPSKPVICNTLF
ncbi:Longitudinals lacking protein, isoforms A/B/D/L [Ooceraea biroi]|uniref:Longitudinals lacking protein, isoforms A/B/D/L n=1 Tax=Ooceraea biroi TaxID=2015173 RepID=A0A026W5H8_OOCBI|nr:Longitudinals lacking protein, isoforms A/B/D/L [Ooceraea biroi]